MGNCLQATETEDVDLLQCDDESVNSSSRPAVLSTGRNSVPRSRSQSTDIATNVRSTRSSRRQNRNSNGSGTESRQRRSSDGTVRPHSVALPPSYEAASMQRSAVTHTGVPSTPTQIYHPSPGVSRQASELTEEEQIKIAQRIGLIHHLPTDVYIEGKKKDTECIICMADFVNGDRVRFLPCMHTYHVDCIDEWLMRSFSCPSCLEPVDSALLTSYDQQQLAAFAEAGYDDGIFPESGACQSLPRQLAQLTAITSPPHSSSLPIMESGNKK